MRWDALIDRLWYMVVLYNYVVINSGEGKE